MSQKKATPPKKKTQHMEWQIFQDFVIIFFCGFVGKDWYDII